MFTITQDEFQQIISILTENCFCGVPYYDCEDSTCDIDKIYNILSRHIEQNFSEESEEDDLPF